METRLRSAMVAEAAKPDRKVVDADAVVALLDRSTLELGDDGTPTNIAEAMDSLLKAKPFLVDGGARPGGADQGARGGEGEKLSSTDGMKPEAIVEALEKGQLDEYLTKSN